MARTKVFDAPFSGINLERLTDILGVSKTNVLGEWYADPRGAGSFYDMSGNARHLAAGNAPSLTQSDIVGNDGNLLNAFAYASTSSQYHSLASATWMSCLTSSHSLTFLVKLDTTGAGTDYLFGRGLEATDGLTVKVDGSSVTATWSRTGASTTATATLTRDGYYHLVHVICNSRTGNVYVDGVTGACATLDATDGASSSEILYLGCYRGPASYLDGKISYCRWQNNALTYTQITREVAAFQGILCTRGGSNKYVVPAFIRSTTSQSSKRAADTQFHTVPANWPVKTSDGAVLIEGSVTPLAGYTADFSTGWTKTRASIAGTSVTLPDGSTSTTAAFHEGVAGDGDTTHLASHALSCTSGTSYCYSKYFKYCSTREWVTMVVSDGTNTKTVSFDFHNRVVGTTSGSLTGGSGIDPREDGWIRCWVWATAGATAAGTVTTYISNADADTDFVGADQDSVYMCWPQIETGAFPTQYQPNPTTGATRSSDFMVVCPFNITKNLGIAGQTPRLLFNGSESLNGATVTPTTGSYSFTKNGRPQNISSEAEGDGWKFNGANDWLNLASSDFNPAGDFSVVASFTPLVSSGVGTIISKYGAAGNRGWGVWHVGSTVAFYRTTDGTSEIYAAVGSALEVGKPVLITASFSTTAGMKLYVDALTAGTQATTTATYASSADCMVGRYDTGNLLNARLNYLAYYDGYAATESDHTTNYARFKVDGILPLSMSSTTDKKHIIIDWEAKGLFSSSTDIGLQRNFFFIGGAYGDGGQTKNSIVTFANTDNCTYWYFWDSTPTGNYIRTDAGNITWGQWHTYRFSIDLATMSNSTVTVDGVSQKDASNAFSGTSAVSLKDAMIRLAQTYGGTPLSHLMIRNFKIFLED